MSETVERARLESLDAGAFAKSCRWILEAFLPHSPFSSAHATILQLNQMQFSLAKIWGFPNRLRRCCSADLPCASGSWTAIERRQRGDGFKNTHAQLIALGISKLQCHTGNLICRNISHLIPHLTASVQVFSKFSAPSSLTRLTKGRQRKTNFCLQSALDR